MQTQKLHPTGMELFMSNYRLSRIICSAAETV